MTASRRSFIACCALAPFGPIRAAPPLPQRNLRVELRVVELREAEQNTLQGQGSVTVGTDGSAAASGSVTLRAGSQRDEAERVQRLLVLNGARASARLGELVPLRSVQWAWLPRGPAAAERLDWIDIGRAVEVRPQWPGGSAAVTVDLAVDSTVPGVVLPARAALATTLQLPLGEWSVIGELQASAARNTTLPAGTVSSAVASSWVLELRVSAP